MAARFGADFGDVRVRHDADAARDARQQGAAAFTRGDEITFAAGKYDTSSSTGKKLLAHELAHVVQQRSGGSSSHAEHRAERAGFDAMAGRAVNAHALGGAPLGIQRQPAPESPAPTEDKKKDADEAAGTSWKKSSHILDKFALDKDTLTKRHDEQIAEIAFHISLHTGMLARGKATIEIVGHADTTGKDPHNEELGQKRADRVREALEKKLAPREGDKPLTLAWSVRSAGEKELLIPTPDETLEPRNRAVEVRVTIESLPAPAPKPPAGPVLDPSKVLKDPPEAPRGPRRPPEQDDWWKKAEENQRKIDEYDRKHPEKKQSLQDVISGGLTKAVDPLIKKLPISSDKKKWLREKLKDAVEAGSEKLIDMAVDASGATGPEGDALKAAAKAALKEKGESKK
jgi:outer membrane protein OmpA-like peptidoglycan-associated protein